MRLWPMPRCAGEAEPHAARSHHGVVVCGGTPIRPTGPADGDGRRSLSALGVATSYAARARPRG